MKKIIENFIINLEGAVINDALIAITQNTIRSVYLMGSSGVLVGVVTEGDIIRGLLSGLTVYAPIKQIYNKSFSYVVKSNIQNADIKSAISLMLSKNLVSIPIVDKNFKLCEVVTFKDLSDNLRLEK